MNKMKKTSIMGNLMEIYENVEKNIKRIKKPNAKLEFVNDTIDWIKTMLDLLNKLKQELGDVNKNDI